MNKNGIWDLQEASKYHASSPKLAQYLTEILDIEKPVYDFGAGLGFYLGKLEDAGFTCYGFEGTPMKRFLCQNMKVCDLTNPLEVQVKGTVLSFETWEHLPEWAEKTFVETLTNACDKTLIVSCATPGQPGHGHWTCRTHHYVKEMITNRGFKFKSSETEEIRQQVDKECDWLERNLLVFERNY